MDGIYLPDGRQFALIDRDWILDNLPHLGNPDDTTDNNYLIANTTQPNSTPEHRTAPTGGPTVSVPSQNTAGHSTEDINNHSTNRVTHSEEFEGDLTLLSEIADETQNKWSDFGLNRLLTPFANSTHSSFK